MGTKDQQRGSPIAPDAVVRITRRALLCETVEFSRHCCDRMRTRGFSSQDVLYVLETGDHGIEQPRWNENHQSFVYSAIGNDIDGDRLKVLFSIENAGALLRVVSGQRHYRGRKV